MIPIIHRVNDIRGLIRTPPQYGVEVDLRQNGREVILQHEAFAKGESFKAYLKHFRHRFIILNIKSDGIETQVLHLLRQRKIRAYFLLDLAFPRLVLLARQGERRLAVRLSEFESVETCLSLRGKARWIWVDCFKRFPLTQKMHDRLFRHFKICLVSPELQGHPLRQIAPLRRKIKGMQIAAVCTDHPELWA